MNQSDITSPELGAVEVDGISRSSFILRGALAAGAATARPRLPRLSPVRWRPVAPATSTS